MLKGKDPYVFVRFGGLDLKNQYGYTPKFKTYHAPPCNRGFYAMPKIAQDFFLLSSIDKYQRGIFPKDYGGDTKEWKIRMSNVRKEFIKKDGCVWHHLESWTKRNLIIESRGSWIKTEIRDWANSFSKMSTTLKWGRHEGGYIVPLGTIGTYTMDECEVFFDEKV